MEPRFETMPLKERKEEEEKRKNEKERAAHPVP